MTGPGPAGPADAGPTDHRWMRLAIDLSRRCPASDHAYSVGAVLVDATGREVARGFSRELDPHDHAEEVALVRAAGDPRLRQATLYSTLEPCSTRRSRPVSCARHVLDAGIPRVVIAWREPALFVEGEGRDVLAAAGVTVVELADLAAEARAVNGHLGPGDPP